MKVFIDLTDVIIDGEYMFAFYDTIIERFEIHNDTSTWSSWEEFEKDYAGKEVDRYKSLIVEKTP